MTKAQGRQHFLASLADAPARIAARLAKAVASNA